MKKEREKEREERKFNPNPNVNLYINKKLSSKVPKWMQLVDDKVNNYYEHEICFYFKASELKFINLK